MNRKEAEQKAKEESLKDGTFHHVVRYDCAISETAPDGLVYRVSTRNPGPLDRPLGTLVSTWLHGEQMKGEDESPGVNFGDNASGNFTITGGIGGDFVLGKPRK